MHLSIVLHVSTLVFSGFVKSVLTTCLDQTADAWGDVCDGRNISWSRPSGCTSGVNCQYEVHFSRQGSRVQFNVRAQLRRPALPPPSVQRVLFPLVWTGFAFIDACSGSELTCVISGVPGASGCDGLAILVDDTTPYNDPAKVTVNEGIYGVGITWAPAAASNDLTVDYKNFDGNYVSVGFNRAITPSNGNRDLTNRFNFYFVQDNGIGTGPTSGGTPSLQPPLGLPTVVGSTAYSCP